MVNHHHAFTRLDQYVEHNYSRLNAPGIAIGLTDRDRLLHVFTHGFADAAAQTPLNPDTLFQIGSISKSFTCAVILQLQQEGLLDVHKPVEHYLPWFQLKTSFEPITLHHLMSHTAGIICGTDATVAGLSETLALRFTETAAPPGTYFHYSNSGYKILGVIIQQLLGKPCAQTVQERILTPLGMTNTRPAITHDLRSRLAVGYEPLYDDRPLPRRGGLLAPATWIESDTADGATSSTPADMTAYLRWLLNRGRSLLSPESFDLMIWPVIKTEDEKHEEFYGYGLGVTRKDDHLLLSHGGSMIGYYSFLLADMKDGLGVIVLTNGPSQPEEIARYSLALLSASLHNRPQPSPPHVNPTRVQNPADYTGTYHRGPKTLTFTMSEAQLILEHAGRRIPLERHQTDQFYAHHPDFSLYPFRFGREDEKVVEVFHGPDWYIHDRYHGPLSFDYPRHWDAYPGHYRAHNPWLTNFRIVLRKGALALIYPDGSEEPLEPLSDARFRIGRDTRSPERIHFSEIIDGKAVYATLDGGSRYARTFTP